MEGLVPVAQPGSELHNVFVEESAGPPDVDSLEKFLNLLQVTLLDAKSVSRKELLSEAAFRSNLRLKQYLKMCVNPLIQFLTV